MLRQLLPDRKNWGEAAHTYRSSMGHLLGVSHITLGQISNNGMKEITNCTNSNST